MEPHLNFLGHAAAGKTWKLTSASLPSCINLARLSPAPPIRVSSKFRTWPEGCYENVNIKDHTEAQQDLPSSGLLYKYHVCQENKSIEFELRNIGLQQYIDFCRRFFNTFLDRNRHTLSQFELLFLTNLRRKTMSCIPTHKAETLAGRSLNSFDRANTRKSSNIDIVVRRC